MDQPRVLPPPPWHSNQHPARPDDVIDYGHLITDTERRLFSAMVGISVVSARIVWHVDGGFYSPKRGTHGN